MNQYLTANNVRLKPVDQHFFILFYEGPGLMASCLLSTHILHTDLLYMKSQAQQFCEIGTGLKISGNWSQQKSVLHNFKSPSHQDSSLTGAFNTDMCIYVGCEHESIWVNYVMGISSAFPCLCEKSHLWSTFQKLGGNVVTSLAGQEWRYRQCRQFTSGPIQVHSDSDSSGSIR